jgi:spore coat polysaccharide biosynthesis protein SpsF
MQSDCTQSFWAGDFGDEYTDRNINLVENNVQFFHKAAGKVDLSVKSIIEFGAGAGNNIRALKRMFPYAEFTGVDVNEHACFMMKDIENIHTVNAPIGFYGEHDLVLCKGILIHIPPDDLDRVYDILHRSAKKNILICEYYNPSPVEVQYRGNDGKLWKRDFAGDLMNKYPDLKLVDYGFGYHRDEFPVDDINWFLLSKGE